MDVVDLKSVSTQKLTPGPYDPATDLKPVPVSVNPVATTSENELVLPGPTAIPTQVEMLPTKDLATDSNELTLPGDAPNPLKKLYDTNSQVDPDRASRVLPLSEKTGAHPSYVDRHLESMEKVAAAPTDSFFDELKTQYPETAKLVSDHSKMAIAHDDLKNLSALEGTLQKAKDFFHSSTAAVESSFLNEELGMTLFQKQSGATQYEGDAFRLGGYLAPYSGVTSQNVDERIKQIKDRLEFLGQYKPTDGFLKKSLFGAAEFAPAQFSGDFGYGLKYAGTAAGLAAATGIGVTAIPGLLAAGTAVGSYDYNYRVMSGHMYDRLSQVRGKDGQKLDPEVVNIVSHTVGAITGGLGVAAAAKVVETFPGGKDFIKSFFEGTAKSVLENPLTAGEALKQFALRWAGTAAHFGLTMGGITATNIAGEEASKGLTGYSEFNHPTGKEVVDQVVESVVSGFGTGLVVGLPGSAASLRHEMRFVKDTEEQRSIYNHIGDKTSELKLKNRSPEDVAKFVDDVTKDGPVSAIHIPLKDAETYFQSKGIDPAKAFEELGVSQSYEEAKASGEGATVQIPLGTWASKIVGTEHFHGLADDVKFHKEAYTQRESDRLKESIKQEMGDRFDAMSSILTPEEKVSSKNAEEVLKEQAKQAGVPDEFIDVYAKIESVRQTLSKRNSVDVAGTYPLDVVGPAGEEDLSPPDDIEHFQDNNDHNNKLNNVIDGSKIFRIKAKEEGNKIPGDSGKSPTKKGKTKKEPSPLDNWLARFGGGKKTEKGKAIVAEAKTAQDPSNPGYVPSSVEGHPIGWTPNYASEPNGVIGGPRILQPQDRSGKPPDQLGWVDHKYGITKNLIRRHKEQGLPLLINTSSDLVGHSDYIDVMPEKTKVVMWLLTRNSELNRILFPGNASRARQERAVEILREEGIDVETVEPTFEDVIKALGGKTKAKKQLGKEYESAIRNALTPESRDEFIERPLQTPTKRFTFRDSGKETSAGDALLVHENRGEVEKSDKTGQLKPAETPGKEEPPKIPEPSTEPKPFTLPEGTDAEQYGYELASDLRFKPEDLTREQALELVKNPDPKEAIRGLVWFDWFARQNSTTTEKDLISKRSSEISGLIPVIKTQRYGTPDGNIWIARGEFKNGVVRESTGPTRERALLGLEAGGQQVDSMPAGAIMGGPWEKAMLVIGANNFLRTKMPPAILQNYDMHLVFRPSSENSFEVGLVMMSRHNDKGLDRLVTAKDPDINKAIEMVMQNAVLESTQPHNNGTFEVEPSHEKMKTWLQNAIYRKPKIGLKDVISLEPYPPGDGPKTYEQDNVPRDVVGPLTAPEEIERLRSELKRVESERDTEAAARRVSDKTGLNNRLAFNEDTDAGEHIGAIDMDGLGRLNDTIGHEAADLVLRELGAHLLKFQEENPGIRFYHLNGDEFAARMVDPIQGPSLLLKAQKELNDDLIKLSDGEGRRYHYNGIGISFGTGDSYDSADRNAYQQKRERIDQGLREDKRQPGRPKRLVEVTGIPSGSEDKGGISQDSSPKTLKQDSSHIDTHRGKLVQIGREFDLHRLKGADHSTWVHELGHYYLSVVDDMVKSGLAGDQLKTDYSKIRSWLGAKDGQDISKPQHEKFAKAMELYLMEGRAPSVELRGAFKKFSKWITEIYAKTKAEYFQGLELTDDVRGVFDRLYATDEEIARAQKDVEISTDEVVDVSPESAQEIKSLQERAHDQAVEDLLPAQMKELTKQHKQFLVDEKERQTRAAEKQVSETPIFKARDFIKGRAKKKPVDELANSMLDGKLDDNHIAIFESAAELNGFESAEALARELIVAEKNNRFDSEVQTLVDAAMSQHKPQMETGELRAKAIEAIHSDKSMELLALESQILSDLKQGELDEAIRPTLAIRRRETAKIAAQAAKEKAQEILGGKPVKKAGDYRPYLTAERNAAVRVSKAIAAKDFEKAAKAKQDQLINHALAREAIKNRREIEKTSALFKKFSSRGQDMLSMPFGFVRQVDQLLAKYKIGEARIEDDGTLSAIARQMLLDGESDHEIANATGRVQNDSGQFVPETLAQLQQRMNDFAYSIHLPDSVFDGGKDFSEMTLSEMRDLKSALKTIVGLGKGNEKWLTLFDALDVKTAAKEAGDSMAENIGGKYGYLAVVGSDRATTMGDTIDRIRNFPNQVAISSMVNLLTLCEYLDLKWNPDTKRFETNPNGAMKKYLYRVLKAAGDKKLVMYDKMTKEVNELFHKYYTPEQFAALKKTKEFLPELGKNVTRSQLMSLVANLGTKTGRDRIQVGYRLPDEVIQKLVDRLSKDEMDFIQSIWNHLETYWPESVALEMRVQDVEPKREERLVVKTRHGDYAGGYFPIAYDSEKSVAALKNAEERTALYKGNSTAMLGTERGSMKSRVNYVDRPVLLDFNKILFDHLEDRIHDLAYREAIIDANRFLHSKDVAKGVVTAIGPKGFRAIEKTINEVASVQREDLSLLDHAADWFRYKGSMFALGYRVAAFAPDISGNVINSAKRLGWAGTAKAITGFLGNRDAHVEFVEANSERMRHRGQLRERDAKTLQNKWEGRESAIRAYAYFFQLKADEAISYPMWMQVYNDHLGEMGHEQAVHVADEAVTKSFGSGDVLDQVDAQRGRGLKKIASTFYSWQSMMFNQAWLDGQIAGLEYGQGNTFKAIQVAATAAFYLWGLQSLQENFWKEIFRNGQKDDDKKRSKRILSRTLNQPLGYIWGVRDLSTFVIDKYLGSGQQAFHLTPIEQSLEMLTMPLFDKEMKVDHIVHSASFVAGVPNQFDTWALNFIDWMSNKGESHWQDLLNRRTKH